MPGILKQRGSRVAALHIVGLLVLSLLLAGTVQASRDDRPQQSKVDQLRAFTKVYGYTRFFHPSDEAAAADWEKLAIDGSARILQMKKNESLDQILLEIFRPVAPTIQIVGEDEEGDDPFDDEVLDGSADLLAWQHRGVGTHNDQNYISVRSNRDNFYGAGIRDMGYITQRIDVSELGGKEIRLSFAAKVETEFSVGFPLGWGSVTLAVYRENGDLGFYDGMFGRPITNPEWNRYETAGILDEDAAELVLRAFLERAGSFWFDDFRCEVRDPEGVWEPVELVNAGFEINPPPLDGWDQAEGEYRYAVDTTDPFAGEVSALIANEPSPAPDQLFTQTPALGETVDKEIGCDLRVILPLALPTETVEESASDNGPGDDDATADVGPMRIAAVVVAWNVFQHFYPYFDAVDVDWDQELTIALTGTLEAQSDLEFFRVLQILTAALQDGHISLLDPYGDLNRATLPIRVAWIEGRVIVVASETPEVLLGDVVIEMDGRPAEQIMEELERYTSGSPQFKSYAAGLQFAVGTRHTLAALTLLRGDEVLQVSVERYLPYYILAPRPYRISEVAENIYYVNLSRATYTEIEAVVDELASATGVIFDLRGYPRGNSEMVISYMIDEQVLSAIWNIPLAIYPDRENLVGWNTTGRWHISPREPRIQGKIVFMTDAGAISYGESVMGIIEAYEIAEIVGRPTAGTNGNINALDLPGGYSTNWTGMKVLKHDGSQHHLIGILPTVPVELTIEAIREGRDEDLEKAIEIIQGG